MRHSNHEHHRRSGSYLLNGLVPAGRHLLSGAQIAQAVQSGPNQIMGIMGAKTFGEDILNSGGLQNRPNRTAGDQTGTGGGRLKHNPSSPKFAMDLMGNTVFGNSYLTHVLTGLLDSFADGLGNLICLTQTMPDPTISVPNHTDRTETEATSTFYNLGRTVDKHDLFDKLVFRIFILEV